MNNVSFSEDYTVPSTVSGTRKAAVFTGFLIRIGVAQNERQAVYVLGTISVVLMVTTFYLMVPLLTSPYAGQQKTAKPAQGSYYSTGQ